MRILILIPLIPILCWRVILTGLTAVWFPQKSKKRQAMAERLLAFSSESGGIKIVWAGPGWRGERLWWCNKQEVKSDLSTTQLLWPLLTSIHPSPDFYSVIALSSHLTPLPVLSARRPSPAPRNYEFTIWREINKLWFYEYCSLVKWRRTDHRHVFQSSYKALT